MKTKRVVVSIFYPYPNTDAYDMSVKEGYIEPAFDYREDVPLTQEKFKKDAVVFVSTYFETFIKLYRLAERMPPGLGKRMERMLDSIFCSRFLPHSFLVKVARLRDRYIEKIKVILKEKSPNLYLVLRDRLLRASR